MRAGFFVALLASLFAHTAAAQITMCQSGGQENCYRFLCNGFDANGSINQGGCGNVPCNDGGAARWSNSTIIANVDLGTTPTGMTQTQWSNVVDDAFAGWGNVSSSTLVFQDVGGSARQFGANAGSHDIFWINGVSEYQQKVGGGVNSALGVTLPQFFCTNPMEITDSDLVMNGAGFDWVATQEDCQFGFCNSAISTLLHELGHFVGVGHPCPQCSWSVMSAQSGFDPEFPLAVDQAVVQSLYPGEPGGIGYGCSGNQDCNNGLTCETVDQLSYCTQTCGTCPTGFECDADAGNICVFSAGELAGAVGEGEACFQRPCEDGLTCVGSGGADFFCFRDCVPGGGGCGGTEDCVALQNGGGVCIDNSGDQGLGQPCGNNALCQQDLLCVTEDAQGNAFCRNACTPGTGQGCFPNEECFELQGGTGACFPRGNKQEGDVCADALECSVGHVCLVDDNQGGARCYRRCDGEFECSSSQQNCVNLQAANVSYCDPINDGTLGEGEGEGPAEGEGEGPGEGEGEGCILDRGHYDCPNGFGCVDDGDGDGQGTCEAGAAGEASIFNLCEEDGDCDSGICHNGVCTRPCDSSDGCPGGYRCEEDFATGGLCVANSCADDRSICDAGFTCAFSPAGRNVCARGVPGGICSHTTAGDGDASEPTGLVAVAVLGFALFRRRRRRRSPAEG